MDDLIYILLGLGIFAFNIYKTYVKNKQKTEIKAENADEETYTQEAEYQKTKYSDDTPIVNDKSIFDILKDELTNDYIIEKEGEVNTELIETETQGVIEDDNPNIAKQNNIINNSVIISDNLEEDFNEEEKKEYNEINFNLKEAVIYSEILKPKYF